MNSTKDRLAGLAFVAVGAAVLYFFAPATIALACGVSTCTAGLLLASGKLPQKPQR